MFLAQQRDALALQINHRFFYGWAMLAVAALGMFASGPAQSHLFSVFIRPISEDLGISRTAVSSAYAGATLLAAFGLPYVGRLVDRFGVRRVVLVVALLFGAACIAFGQVDHIVLLALGFAALRFLGQGSLMLCSANLVAQWFSRQRGFALSLMALGFSASIAVHPPLAQWLIDQVGWREAWLWLGLITWALLLPPILLLVQNRPEDLGLVPDGGARTRRRRPGRARRARRRRPHASARRCARPAFWIIALSFATFSMLVTGLFFHQVAIFNNRGIGSQAAAQLFSVSALTMVLAMPLFGRLLDRLPTRPMFACAMLTMTAAMLALVMVAGRAERDRLQRRVRHQQRRDPQPHLLSLAALLRPPPSRQHPGHARRPSAWSAPRSGRSRSARRSTCSAATRAPCCCSRCCRSCARSRSC